MSHVDTAAAAAARQGDRDAIELVLRDLQPAVVRTVRLIVGPGRAASEDAAQEAMIDIYRGLCKLKDPTAVEAWALRIATRRAVRAARWERVRQASIVPLEVAARLASTQSSRLSDELARAFYALPPRQRAVAVLRLYLGLSEAEVAAALTCSLGTVKSQLHDARTRLQAAVQEGAPQRV
ncbi:MAG: sigma-70 family RNA polymerase sigma factor [Gaiellaceae bacterium]